MLPENCGNIVDLITLSSWKKFWIDSEIEEINGELKEQLMTFFDEYISITPFDAIGVKSYKTFLKSKLPENKIVLSAKKTSTGIQIKKCIKPLIYQSFFESEEFNYGKFIDYIVTHTFEPLSHKALIEVQKNKLTKMFTELCIKYLNQ